MSNENQDKPPADLIDRFRRARPMGSPDSPPFSPSAAPPPERERGASQDDPLSFSNEDPPALTANEQDFQRRLNEGEWVGAHLEEGEKLQTNPLAKPPDYHQVLTQGGDYLTAYQRSFGSLPGANPIQGRFIELVSEGMLPQQAFEQAAKEFQQADGGGVPPGGRPPEAFEQPLPEDPITQEAIKYFERYSFQECIKDIKSATTAHNNETDPQRQDYLRNEVLILERARAIFFQVAKANYLFEQPNASLEELLLQKQKEIVSGDARLLGQILAQKGQDQEALLWSLIGEENGSKFEGVINYYWQNAIDQIGSEIRRIADNKRDGQNRPRKFQLIEGGWNYEVAEQEIEKHKLVRRERAPFYLPNPAQGGITFTEVPGYEHIETKLTFVESFDEAQEILTSGVKEYIKFIEGLMPAKVAIPADSINSIVSGLGQSIEQAVGYLLRKQDLPGNPEDIKKMGRKLKYYTEGRLYALAAVRCGESFNTEEMFNVLKMLWGGDTKERFNALYEDLQIEEGKNGFVRIVSIKLSKNDGEYQRTDTFSKEKVRSMLIDLSKYSSGENRTIDNSEWERMLLAEAERSGDLKDVIMQLKSLSPTGELTDRLKSELRAYAREQLFTNPDKLRFYIEGIYDQIYNGKVLPNGKRKEKPTPEDIEDELKKLYRELVRYESVKTIIDDCNLFNLPPVQLPDESTNSFTKRQTEFQKRQELYKNREAAFYSKYLVRDPNESDMSYYAKKTEFYKILYDMAQEGIQIYELINRSLLKDSREAGLRIFRVGTPDAQGNATKGEAVVFEREVLDQYHQKILSILKHPGRADLNPQDLLKKENENLLRQAVYLNPDLAVFRVEGDIRNILLTLVLGVEMEEAGFDESGKKVYKYKTVRDEQGNERFVFGAPCYNLDMGFTNDTRDKIFGRKVTTQQAVDIQDQIWLWTYESTDIVREKIEESLRLKYLAETERQKLIAAGIRRDPDFKPESVSLDIPANSPYFDVYYGNGGFTVAKRLIDLFGHTAWRHIGHKYLYGGMSKGGFVAYDLMKYLAETHFRDFALEMGSWSLEDFYYKLNNDLMLNSADGVLWTERGKNANLKRNGVVGGKVGEEFVKGILKEPVSPIRSFSSKIMNLQGRTETNNILTYEEIESFVVEVSNLFKTAKILSDLSEKMLGQDNITQDTIIPKKLKARYLGVITRWLRHDQEEVDRKYLKAFRNSTIISKNSSAKTIFSYYSKTVLHLDREQENAKGINPLVFGAFIQSESIDMDEFYRINPDLEGRLGFYLSKEDQYAQQPFRIPSL